LLDADGGEVARMLLGPVRVTQAPLPYEAGYSAAEIRDGERVVKPDGDAFGQAVQAVERAGVVDMRERQPEIVVRRAGIERAGDGVRQNARHRDTVAHFGDQHADLVVDADPEI